MLSYQHKFHFGNHADVIKHLTLIALIELIQQKAKPAFFLDTHSGEGAYSLTQITKTQDQFDYQALYNANQHKGESNNTTVQQYLELIDYASQTDQYPGSPFIFSKLMREQDTLHLNELGKSIFTSLKSQFKQSASLHNRDGFECLNALTPPTPRRGMALIDPPYEQLEEYGEVANTVSRVLKKWPNGILAIWYPILSQYRKGSESSPKTNSKHDLHRKMLNALLDNTDSPILNLRLDQSGDAQYGGMYASGIVIINPPYGIDKAMQPVLDECYRCMSASDAKSPMIQWLRKPE